MPSPTPSHEVDPASQPPIRVEDLERTYGEGSQATHALQGVSFQVEPGRLVAIQGRSGSGKTTLLNLVAGLDDPDAGTVHLLGDDVTDMDVDARLRLRAESVGFVFQEAALVPELKLWENVAIAARIGGVHDGDLEETARAALEQVDLAEQWDRYPGEVSGGEAQRASVARALVKSPAILLADEPTANLDHATARRVAERIQAHVREVQAAALVVTHDDVMAGVAHQVHRLRNGRILDGDEP